MVILQQWTGTPPYIAHKLLSGSGTLHLYRHDIELLFYVMLLTVACHLILTHKRNRGGRLIRWKVNRLPYKDWFRGTYYHLLGSLKLSFITKIETIEVSPEFRNFCTWLPALQQCFVGFKRKPLPRVLKLQTPTGVQQDFDNETLGREITYTNILADVHWGQTPIYPAGTLRVF